VDDQELHRVFNCGIGMVLVVAAADAERAMRSLQDAGETVFRLGGIEARGADGTAVRLA
jgi:phosphoribosylformylglycinamidine cyclo-ligase